VKEMKEVKEVKKVEEAFDETPFFPSGRS